MQKKKKTKSTEFPATLCDERFINFYIIKKGNCPCHLISDIQYSVVGSFCGFYVRFCIVLSYNGDRRPAHEISNSNGMKFWWSLLFFVLFFLLKCLWRLASDSNFGWNAKHKEFFSRIKKTKKRSHSRPFVQYFRACMIVHYVCFAIIFNSCAAIKLLLFDDLSFFLHRSDARWQKLFLFSRSSVEMNAHNQKFYSFMRETVTTMHIYNNESYLFIIWYEFQRF